MDVRMQYDARDALGVVQATPPTIRRAMLATGEDVQSLWLVQMRRYPPPIALRISVSAAGRIRERLGNGYRRTGTLRKSWFTKPPRLAGATVVAEVVSSGQIAPYNIYVQMEGVQAWMHVSRWITEVQVIEQTRPQIAQIAQRRLNDALRGLR